MQMHGNSEAVKEVHVVARCTLANPNAAEQKCLLCVLIVCLVTYSQAKCDISGHTLNKRYVTL